MPKAEVMKNRLGAGRRFKLRSNRAPPALRRRACRAILSSVLSSVAAPAEEEAISFAVAASPFAATAKADESAKGDAATAGQMTSNRCFWSKRPANGENPNPDLSQCVAVSRSDKIIIRAGCPRPFFASETWRLCVSSPFFGVEKSKPVKLNQSESKRFCWSSRRSESHVNP